MPPHIDKGIRDELVDTFKYLKKHIRASYNDTSDLDALINLILSSIFSALGQCHVSSLPLQGHHRRRIELYKQLVTTYFIQTYAQQLWPAEARKQGTEFKFFVRMLIGYLAEDLFRITATCYDCGIPVRSVDQLKIPDHIVPWIDNLPDPIPRSYEWVPPLREMKSEDDLLYREDRPEQMYRLDRSQAVARENEDWMQELFDRSEEWFGKLTARD